jgi:hypothetical protein
MPSKHIVYTAYRVFEGSFSELNETYVSFLFNYAQMAVEGNEICIPTNVDALKK